MFHHGLLAHPQVARAHSSASRSSGSLIISDLTSFDDTVFISMSDKGVARIRINTDGC